MAKRIGEMRDYILNNVGEHPTDIVSLVVSRFHVSRQSASRHVAHLVNTGLLVANGKTRARKYELRKFVNELFPLNVSQGFEEDVVWREKVSPLLKDIPKNVLDICQYGVTEILNNALSHSESLSAYINVQRSAILVQIRIGDEGVGIFSKIQKAFNLHDPRHALLELTKGKLTSEQASHTGEGIFFTSRMFDRFSILSGTLFFDRINKESDDWLIEVEDRNQTKGTFVSMEIHTTSHQTMSGVFAKATSGEIEHGFSRTHVPVKLARYGTEQLVSRSQARRVLARFDRFEEVSLDFRDVNEIGPAFADEIFRVYQRDHPEIRILSINCSPQVQQMADKAMEAIELAPI